MTVTLRRRPLSTGLGALTTKCVAASGLTVIALLVPVMLVVGLSVAVSVWLPAVAKVALNVPIPADQRALAGKRSRTAVAAAEIDGAAIAGGRVVEAVLGRDREARMEPLPSSCQGALTTKCVAAALTVIALLVPVRVAAELSVAVSVWLPAVPAWR